MSWAPLAKAPLENDRVLLEPLEERDRSALLALALEPRIWDYFVLRIDTPEQFHRWFDNALAQQEAGTRIAYRILDLERGLAAGLMCYSTLVEAERRLEIGGSWLGVDFQGTGVNRAAKHALLRHAFEVLEAERVEFKTDVLNAQARRALADIGAVEEGVLRSYNYMPGGRRRDAVYYSVLRAEWPAVGKALADRIAAPGGRTDSAGVRAAG